MTVSDNTRPAAIRVVMPFVFRHWLKRPRLMLAVAFGFLGATVADLFMPIFSGHLVDALTLGAADADARRAIVAIRPLPDQRQRGSVPSDAALG